MRLLKNMKITGKLLTGFLLMLAVMIFVISFGVLNVRRVDDGYSYLLDYPLQRYLILRDVELMLMDARRIKHNVAFNRGLRSAIEPQEALFQELRAQMDNTMDELRHALHQDNIISDTDRAAQLAAIDILQNSIRNYFGNYLEVVIESAMAGMAARVTHYVHVGTIVAQETDADFERLFEMSRRIMTDLPAQLSAQTNSTIQILIVLSFASGILVVLIAIILSRALSRPVNEVAKVLNDVAGGDFNINTRTDLPTDEIGLMTRDIYGLVSTFKNIMDGIRKFIYESTERGNLNYILDETRYNGGYRELIESINQFDKHTKTEMFAVMDVLDSINKGNFDTNVAPLPGDKAILNEKVDALMENLSHVSVGINSMINAAAVKGDLSFKIDDSAYDGDWREIMIGLNKIADAVNLPIIEIRESMAALNSGKFDTIMIGQYAGDFEVIQTDVNGMILGLASYVREIGACLNAVAKGDLTRSIAIDFVGEFDEIKQSVKLIVDTLNKTMSEISLSSAQVLAGSKQISASAVDLANGAQQQAASVEELNTTVEMINQQTQQNAENATEASNISNKSAANAQEGNDAMKQLTGAMAQIKESSNDISKIIKTIQDIAFQTNLLALNAAVEAARAGEHGRGFAVVAEEVRSLAGRSQTAATETTGLISNSINRVETGSDIAQSTAQSLDTIVENAAEVLEIINRITSASKEQAEAISQIVSGISQISKVVQSNSAVSEQTAASSQELTSQAEMLQRLVSYFKL